MNTNHAKKSLCPDFQNHIGDEPHHCFLEHAARHSSSKSCFVFISKATSAMSHAIAFLSILLVITRQKWFLYKPQRRKARIARKKMLRDGNTTFASPRRHLFLLEEANARYLHLPTVTRSNSRHS
jgi:hypothetical protein